MTSYTVIVEPPGSQVTCRGDQTVPGACLREGICSGVYGRSGEFRAARRALSLACVVIIPCDYQVTLAKDRGIRADQAIASAVFERRSCGNGAKGPRYSDWGGTVSIGDQATLP